jgi:acetate---CoA ligase (ADP-forming)
MRNLEPFFNPSSIAIVGASPHKEKMGNVLLRNIRLSGWKGRIFCVNPSHKKIGDAPCFSKLSKIRKKIDLVLIAIPAPFIYEAIKDGAEANPKISNFVVISAGFKETGPEGKIREEQLAKLAKEKGLNILGPNCLGFINPKMKLNASFTSGIFKLGKVAIVSQSGALGVALLDWTENLALGFSKVISIGNKTDLGETDIMNYLASNKDTQAIALYLEDIKDGFSFISSVSEIIRKKPVFILKAGKNTVGQKAISSHTGSLAQDEAVISAVFEKIGVVEAKNIAEFQDLILYAGSDAVPTRKEVIVITNAGGPGVLAADFIGKSKSIKLLNFPEKFKKELQKHLPESASVQNPIDVIGDAPPERYADALRHISQKYASHPILIILTPQSQTDPEKVAKILVGFKKKFPVLTTCFMGGVKIQKAMEYLHQNGVANFECPERALAVIEKLVRFNSARKIQKISTNQKEIKLRYTVNTILQSAAIQKRKMLFWSETEKIFRSYGSKLVRSLSVEEVKNIDFRKLRYPCALKTDDPKIIHRWDSKAVILNIQNEKELKVAFSQMKKKNGAKKVLIQPMEKPGLELFIGLKRDKVFGPVIVCGLGGTFTEIWKDRIILIPPLTTAEIVEGLKKLQIYPILKGYRGDNGYNLKEITNIILALQDMAAENPDIAGIDINPVMVYNNGKEYKILDAKVYL